LELLLQKVSNEQHATAPYKVVVVDTLDNSCEESLERVKKLTSASDQLHFRNVDIRDSQGLAKGTKLCSALKVEIFIKKDGRKPLSFLIELPYSFLFAMFHWNIFMAVLDEYPDIDSCVHFAGKKAVGESVAKPLDYYHCNVAGTINLLQRLEERGIKRFVFSSSATVYGEPERLPLDESCRLQATNPYGRTKLFIEEILRDCYAADNSWNILILRYFNPIGAHPSGNIGEDPQGIPNNLMPFVAQVCVGRREKLSVFGDDYDTPDGTGVRDYIHVVDLAKGHVAALDALYSRDVGCEAVNLGTGTGISVLQLVEGMARATGKPVPYTMSPRRPGDVATVFANPDRAKKLLGWEAKLGLKEMCEDTWRWQMNNPCGYRQELELVEEKQW
jgi:UDP-glucose 4-epimerase